MSGHERTMTITPSRWQWHKFKDQVHFYILLGAIPLGLLITYVNVFIGPATLTPIPEGYEPNHWEYYRVISLFNVIQAYNINSVK